MNCKQCNGPNICNKCDTKYFKVIIDKDHVNCDLCDKDGFIIDYVNEICIKCNENCIFCRDSQTCISCKGGYFLNPEGKCLVQKVLSTNIKESSNVSQINFVFNDSWPVFFLEIKKYVVVRIDNLPKNYYNYTFSGSMKENNSYIVVLSFDFKKEIENDVMISIDLTHPLSLNDEFLVLNKSFTIKLTKICVYPFFLNKSL